MVFEGQSRRELVVRAKPVVQKDACCFCDSLVAAGFPRLDGLSKGRHTGACAEARSDVEQFWLTERCRLGFPSWHDLGSSRHSESRLLGRRISLVAEFGGILRFAQNDTA